MPPPEPLSLGQIVGIVLALIFAGVVLALSLWGTRKNADLAGFAALRKSSPSYFRNLVLVCRFNGPLVFLMSLGCAIASPGLIFDESIPWLVLRILGAAFGFLNAVGWLYLSWRWTRWSYRTSLAAKMH